MNSSLSAATLNASLRTDTVRYVTVQRQTRDEQSRFRISLWPGQAVEVPPVPRSASRVVGRLLVYEWDRLLGDEPLPSEAYLREGLEIDAQDDDALVQFTETCGQLTGVGRDPLVSLPDFSMAPRSARRLRGAGIARFARERDLLPMQVVTLEAVRFHLRL